MHTDRKTWSNAAENQRNRDQERRKTGSLKREPKNRFNTVEFALFHVDKGIAPLTPLPATFSVVMAILQMTQE